MDRVLVLSPHPDDEAIGCGGTLCRHVAEGHRAKVVYLTSGERGGHGRDPVATARLREDEAAAATRILGVEHIEFWRLPDGALRADATVVQRIARLLCEWQPRFVYTTHAAEQHADHRAACRLLRGALRAVDADTRPQAYLFEVWTPLGRLDRIVDISPWMERKVRAVRAYASQCAALRFDEAVTGLNRYRGEAHSWPGGDYAEVFQEMAT